MKKLTPRKNGKTVLNIIKKEVIKPYEYLSK